MPGEIELMPGAGATTWNVPVADCPSGFCKRNVAVKGKAVPPMVTCTRTRALESTQIPACAISNVPEVVVTNARTGERALTVATVSIVGVFTSTCPGEIELILIEEAKLNVNLLPVVPKVCVADGVMFTSRAFAGPPET